MILTVGIIIFLLLVLTCFIVSMCLVHQNKQLSYIQTIASERSVFEKTLLSSKLEIQEQTFRDISREIHDNINLSLTLAKLHLNTIAYNNVSETQEKVATVIDLLSESIGNLGDISKGLNPELVARQGLLKSLEGEIRRIRNTGLLAIEYSISGNLVFMNAQKELIIFRIIQESFNNIIRHSKARHVQVRMYYNESKLHVAVADDGIGFNREKIAAGSNAGLLNMESRINMLNGTMTIESAEGSGTTLSFQIPLG